MNKKEPSTGHNGQRRELFIKKASKHHVNMEVPIINEFLVSAKRDEK
jgi:hypothetical protein